MSHRLIAAALASAALTASTLPAHAAFTTIARPGESRFAAAEQFPPRNTVRPAISGIPRDGETLRATSGEWARGVEATSGVWLRDGVQIGSGETYAATTADVGSRLVHRVTATNAGGSRTADSLPTIVVLESPPRNITRPQLTGAAVVGSLLTADPGTWTGSPTSFSLRWSRCAEGTCRTIAEGEETEHLITGEDAGGTISVEVTAANDGGTGIARSGATDDVRRATFTQVLCRDVDGTSVGADGDLPDGLSFGRNVAAFPGPAPASTCGSGGDIPLTTGAGWSTTSPNAGGWLQYRGAADVEFAHTTLYRAGTTSGGFGWGIDTSATRSLAATPSAETCRPLAGCASRGSLLDPFGAANRVEVPRGDVDGFNVVLLCDTPPCAADGTQTVRLAGGRVALRDTTTPRATAPPTGSLVTDPALEGREQIAYDVTDTGAGLYRLRIRIGSQEVATRPFRTAPTACGDVDPGDDDPYEFAFRRPCPQGLSLQMGFDTTGWPESGRLRILVEDAGRNTLVLVDRSL